MSTTTGRTAWLGQCRTSSDLGTRRCYAWRVNRGARIRVLLVDDHQLVTDALTRALTTEGDIAVVGAIGSVAAVRRAMSRCPDVVLMDYLLPDGTGAEATRIVKSIRSTAKVVMLTAVGDDRSLIEALDAGVDDYVTKASPVEAVIGAVRGAARRETPSPSLVRPAAVRLQGGLRGLDRLAPPERLTPRERQVLQALVDGLDTSSVCERLSISRNTLRTHTTHIMAKLHAHSKLEAVAAGLRYGLVRVTTTRPYAGDAD